MAEGEHMAVNGGGDVELVDANGDYSGASACSRSRRAVKSISLVRLIAACMAAGGVQYGWALQLSLLTPYVQVFTWSTTTLHACVNAFPPCFVFRCFVGDVRFAFL